jgi:uncharacterized protein (TIGR02246 family)
VATACVESQPELNASASIAEIEARTVAFSSAVVGASAAGWADSAVAVLADFYTQEAVVFPPRGDPLRGRDALRRYWTRAPEQKILTHVVTPERIEVDRSLATEHGWFKLTFQRGEALPTLDSARYVSIWIRGTDGSWRKHLDNWW